jgi:hypothetical protein
MKECHPNFELPDVNVSYNVPVTTRTDATQTSKIQDAGSTVSGKVADWKDFPIFRLIQKDLHSTIAALQSVGKWRP